MGRIFNQKEWLEELDETGPEKGGKQATISASRTKLLDNGRGSETSTFRESSLHADVGQTSWKVGLLFVRGMVYSKMSGEYEVAF